MNMLASLRYLVALSEHRHYARAAQSCSITQPALSNALRALEKEFGIDIVKRGRTYAGLTPEGELVLGTAQRMLHEHALLEQELRSSAAQPQGALRLGVVPTAVPVATRFAALLRQRCPGVTPVVRSLSSKEIEQGLENLSLDLGLGFLDRLSQRGNRFKLLPLYAEHYFLVRRSVAATPARTLLQFGAAVGWREAAQLPLCLLTPEMHNRSIVDSAFAGLGLQVKPVMETNSVLALALSVAAGDVCGVLPGALVDAVRAYAELEAAPLVAPEVTTPVGFFTLAAASPSRALQAAVLLAQDAEWLRHAAQHSGALHSRLESAHT
ncbi:MAG: LysR family transcriptional regulator [Pseudomonadota bacterium]|nr:LysR family transcriptional regulator [Pseudomonadota bacterium]